MRRFTEKTVSKGVAGDLQVRFQQMMDRNVSSKDKVGKEEMETEAVR